MLKQKRKRDRFLNASRIFAIHLALYIGGVVLYWYSFVAEITYPGNAISPVSRWEINSVNRMNFTLIWGIIILLHFAVVLTLNWRKNRQIAQTDQNIRWDETRVDEANYRLQSEQDDVEDEYLSGSQQSSSGITS